MHVLARPGQRVSAASEAGGVGLEPVTDTRLGDAPTPLDVVEQDINPVAGFVVELVGERAYEPGEQQTPETGQRIGRQVEGAERNPPGRGDRARMAHLELGKQHSPQRRGAPGCWPHGPRPAGRVRPMSTLGGPAPDRNVAMELVRVTEAAAMTAARWMGRGDKEGADGAAVDAMRVVLATVAMDGIVVIGEGEKDEAPMLYNGEKIGTGDPPATDIAVDPIDGTTLTSLGRGGALAVIAVSDLGTMFNPGPCVYLEKIAVGPKAAGSVDVRRPPTENLEAVAKALGKSLRDVTVVILDRPRHKDLIEEVRVSGARIKLISDGDVAGAIS